MTQEIKLPKGMSQGEFVEALREFHLSIRHEREVKRISQKWLRDLRKKYPGANRIWGMRCPNGHRAVYYLTEEPQDTYLCKECRILYILIILPHKYEEEL